MKREIFVVSNKENKSLFIVVYPGKGTAEKVYNTVRELEKRDKIEIKTAATLDRAGDSKLRLKHRQRLTLWKDEFDVGSIGLILAGARAGHLAGALIDALVNPRRCFELHEAKAFLDDKLGPDDSGLIFLVENEDWEAIQDDIGLTGEELTVELTVRAEKRLAEIAADEGVAAAVREYVEIEELTR